MKTGVTQTPLVNRGQNSKGHFVLKNIVTGHDVADVFHPKWADKIVVAVNSHEPLIRRIEILGRMVEKATGWTTTEIAEAIAKSEGGK